MFYKDCSYLSIWNFDMINKTKDFRYLVVGYDELNPKTEPKKNELDGAEQHWTKILDEWVEIVDDNKVSLMYDLASELNYLKMREAISTMLLEQMYSRIMEDETLEKYIKALKEWEYYWDKNQEHLENIERILKEIKADKNKIGLKESEYESLQSKNEESQSIEKQSVIVEHILGKNNIDLKTTSVKKWYEIIKLADQVNQERKKTYGK